MFFALLAAAVTPVPDFDVLKILSVCEAVHSHAGQAVVQRKYPQLGLEPWSREKIEEKVTRAAMAAQGMSPELYPLVDRACFLYLSGKVDEIVNGKSYPINAMWEYPDGRRVPLDQFVASLPVAPD